MKKQHLLLCAFLLTAMTAWADNNDWHFSINADGTATVICYKHPGKVWINGMEVETLVTDNCYRGDAEIPSVTPEGQTVTGIGDNCFYNCTALTSVKIPNTIKRIGNTAFEYCKKLKEITIPSSVEEMGSNAIWNCDSIERLIIMDNPNTLQIPSGYEMFRSLRGLRYIYQGRNMVSLDDTWKQVFRSMNGPVELIEQGPQVTQIEEGAFEDNDSLKTVRLSPNVTVIPKDAFDSCESLETVEAGAITSIGENAFCYCYALKATPDLSHCKEILGAAFSRCKSIERVVIPASVDTLGYGAFWLNESLTELVIEDCDRPLKVGSSGMFRDSDSHIKKAYFGRNAESTSYLQYAIIEDNPSVEEITFAGSCSYLRSSEFAGCYALKTVRLGKNMKDIQHHAFGWSSQPLEQLTTLVCEAVMPPECKDGALQAIDKQKCTLHVPNGTIDAYRVANEWKDFYNIIDDIEIYQYNIGTAQEWIDFAIGINDGSIEGNANARMTADIDLGDSQMMIGTNEHPYQGVFDGQGHTLTVNYNMAYYEAAVAPFSVVANAIIKKLHVDGSIKQQVCAAGGVVGTIMGNLVVRECWVTAYMYVQGYGNLQGTIGGIASYCDNPNVRDCKILIEDCLLSGELGTGIHSGTIMSHVNGYYDNHATLRNCLSVGTLPEASGQTGTFIRPIQGESFDIINCFYKDAFGAVQGTQATDEQLANREIAFALQAGRAEYVWVQDLDWGMPMLLVFSRNPDPDRIDSPRMATENEAVYDLSGRRLGSKPSRPGLYIIGGKKAAVK